MLRILVFTDYYRPDGGPAAPLYTMLCEALTKRGHEVNVVTSVPHYPSGKVPQPFRGKLLSRSVENGVRIVRVGLPSVDRNRLRGRLLQFVVYQFLATIVSLRKNYDVFLTHSPAFETWLPFFYHSLLRGKPAIYSVHDLYPDVGMQLGIFRRKVEINLVRFLENFYYKRSGKIRVLASTIGEKIIERGVPREKIALIYDWIEEDKNIHFQRDNQFSREYQLCNHFVVMYAGNIGFVQGLENVIEAAELLKEHHDIRFIFVGDGGSKEQLFRKVSEYQLDNVQFIPYQARERMPEVLASADVTLVSLKKGTGMGALPSKIYTSMVYGSPIIAVIDETSDGWKLVERSGAGICVPPGDCEKLAEAVMKLKHDDDLRKRCGNNGYQYVRKFHSPEYAAVQFEELFFQLVKSKDVRQP